MAFLLAVRRPTGERVRENTTVSRSDRAPHQGRDPNTYSSRGQSCERRAPRVIETVEMTWMTGLDGLDHPALADPSSSTGSQDDVPDGDPPRCTAPHGRTGTSKYDCQPAAKGSTNG